MLLITRTAKENAVLRRRPAPILSTCRISQAEQEVPGGDSHRAVRDAPPSLVEMRRGPQVIMKPS